MPQPSFNLGFNICFLSDIPLSAVKIQRVTTVDSRLRSHYCSEMYLLHFLSSTESRQRRSLRVSTQQSAWKALIWHEPRGNREYWSKLQHKKWFYLPNSARSEIIHVAGSIFRL